MLGVAERPDVAAAWIARSKARDLLERIGRDERPVTHEVLDPLALEAARAAFLDSVTGAAPDSLVTHGSAPRNRYTVEPAASTTRAGVKIGTYWPGNDQYGLPRHHSTLLLLDQRIGRIAAVLEVGAANAYRTAAADALAVQTLARADSQVLAVFGTGHQALHDARAVSRVRPIRQVLVVGRSEQRAAAMAGTLRGIGLDAAPAEARDACAAADAVVTATTSTVDDAPLFEAEWIRPGAHVSCMGADAPGKREPPPPLLARATLFCDLPQQSRRLGELQHAPADAPVLALARTGLYTEPTSAQVVPALAQFTAAGHLRPDDDVVAILTGSGHKAAAAMAGLLDLPGSQ
ncbi:ornithine cyclodeaminase family protein [Streptomyces sp. NPDC002845]